jgi:DNA-binding transcriptional LysR family regulator
MLNEVDLSRADLNLLVLFEAVLAERHVGRAADKLSLTASAVSHGLGRLRKLLNDPLFLRTPKGVVPTDRATELAGPIAEILARVRTVVGAAEPFDPTKSTRRFMVGAPDGALAVFLPQLLAALRRSAPRIDIGVRQLLPARAAKVVERAWDLTLADLDARELDVAIIPIDAVPARFVGRVLFEEDFVVVTRPGHPFARNPTLDCYCENQHLLVSATGDQYGFFDMLLAGQGRSRRVAITVPNFMMALAVVAETDLLASLPRRLVAMHAARFGVVTNELPIAHPRSIVRAVATKAAVTDAGVAWLIGILEHVSQVHVPRAAGKTTRKRRLG